MFFKTEKKDKKNNLEVFPKVQTAEGWRRDMLKKSKKQGLKKA